jgi:ankyrin repeat protein
VLLLPPQFKSTPLHDAAIKGHKDVAELLLGHKADVNSVDKVSADGCAEG